MPEAAQSLRSLRSAIDFGSGLRPLRTMTPWSASMYGLEKSTFLERSGVIVS